MAHERWYGFDGSFPAAAVRRPRLRRGRSWACGRTALRITALPEERAKRRRQAQTVVNEIPAGERGFHFRGGRRDNFGCGGEGTAIDLGFLSARAGQPEGRLPAFKSNLGPDHETGMAAV